MDEVEERRRVRVGRRGKRRGGDGREDVAYMSLGDRCRSFLSSFFVFVYAKMYNYHNKNA
jgi:hypothetical protein